MEIETLTTMNEGMYLSLLMMIKVIGLTSFLLALSALAVHLAVGKAIAGTLPASRKTKSA